MTTVTTSNSQKFLTLTTSYINSLDHWSAPDRIFKPLPKIDNYQNEVITMIDLSTRTIQNLFEQQVKKLTQKTQFTKEDSFDFQMSGVWLQ